MSRAIRRVIVKTSKAPCVIGLYSQAVVVDKTMYISGQIGLNPETMTVVGNGSDVKMEARQALTNMGEILKSVGATFNNVVKATILLKDMNDFKAVNEVYAGFFKDSFPPARVAYQVAALPRNALVEIEAIAVLGDIKDEPMTWVAPDK